MIEGRGRRNRKKGIEKQTDRGGKIEYSLTLSLSHSIETNHCPPALLTREVVGPIWMEVPALTRFAEGLTDHDQSYFLINQSLGIILTVHKQKIWKLMLAGTLFNSAVNRFPWHLCCLFCAVVCGFPPPPPLYTLFSIFFFLWLSFREASYLHIHLQNDLPFLKRMSFCLK